MNYFPGLDFLRIVLASIVMFGHDKIIMWPYAGKLAVEVFFALSGWLIAGILLKINSGDLPKFYFNRAIRVWGPYFFALALIVLASLLRDPVDLKWLEFVLYKITFVYNIFGPPQLAEFRGAMPLDGTANHFWSVDAEEQFYLLAPLILVVFPRVGRLALTWVFLSLAAVYFNIYPAIFMGVLAAVVQSRHEGFYLTKTARAALLFSLVITGALLGFYGYGVHAPVFAIALVLLLAKPGPQHPWGKFLGGISYPLYLNHWIGVFMFNMMLEPFGLRDSPVRQFLACLANYAVAAVLYLWVDQKLISHRENMYTAPRAKAAMWAAYILVGVGLILGVLVFAP